MSIEQLAESREVDYRLSKWIITNIEQLLLPEEIEEIWRDEIPLLCRGNEVLLVAGVGAGGVPAWNAGNRNIRLQWRGELPWACGESEEENNGERL